MSEWSNFHSDIIAQIKHQLQPLILPQYLILTETRVYLERQSGEQLRFVPDLGLAPTQMSRTRGGAATATAEIEPETYFTLLPEEHREPFLVLRDRRNNEVVTVIEILSPTNKLPGSDGHRAYTLKREELLRTDVNLIEIDLLRGGERPKLSRPLPADTDYAVLLHRGSERPKTLVWQFTLRNRIPEIPVPLTPPDADVPLDLQRAVQSIYDEYGYPLRVPYHEPLRPAPRPGDEAWIQELLRQV